MKKRQIQKDLQNIDELLYEQFLENIDTDLVLEENLQGVEFDDSWIDVIYDSIECLDTIVRNPRRFIMQEEEIVPVEKAKKISVETVRHLAQHTDLIQEVSADGSITPSSVLNVHKEESVDIYENRFIATLLYNLYEFIQQRKEIMGEGSYANNIKKLIYEGETEFQDQMVKVKVDFYSNQLKESDNKEQAEKKLGHIEMIIGDFLGSSFMREMQGLLPVRSPIRKTNVILKDQNFRKAVDLWHFIESYDVLDRKNLNNYRKYKNPTILKEKMDEVFLLNHAIVNPKAKYSLNPQISNYYIRRMITSFMSNHKVSVADFRKMVTEELREYKKAEQKKYRIAKRELNKLFRKYDANHKKMLKLLDERAS